MLKWPARSPPECISPHHHQPQGLTACVSTVLPQSVGIEMQLNPYGAHFPPSASNWGSGSSTRRIASKLFEDMWCWRFRLFAKCSKLDSFSPSFSAKRKKKGVHMGAGWLRKDVYNRRTAPRVRAIHSIQLGISYQFLLRQTSIPS